MNELERVREQIILRFRRYHSSCMFCSLEGECFNNDADAGRAKGEYRRNPLLCVASQRDADQILKTKGISIERDVQSLPYYPNTIFDCNAIRAYKEGQQDMLKPDSEGNHWVKVRPKEE